MVPPHNPPSTFQPASSSRDEVDSLVRHAELHAEHLTALHGAASRFLRRYNKFARMRAEILLLRSRMTFEMTVYSDQRRFVTESQESFLREATLIFQSLPPEFTQGKLQALQDQVIRDHKRQDEYLKRMFDTETELSDLEYTLQQKEFSLAQAAQRMADALGQYELPDLGRSQPSTAPTLVDEEEVPHLVQHYFETAGDVGIERDKIVELEIDHREERERRIFQADQDLPLSISDEEFEDTFNKQRTDAERALADALRRADNAKQVCIDCNLDPEHYRNKLLVDPRAGSDRSISDEEVDEGPESPIPTATPDGGRLMSGLPVINLDRAQTPSVDQFITSILETTPNLAPATSASQGLSSRQRQQVKSAPLENRILDWIDTVRVEAVDSRSGYLSRSRSSDSYSSPIVLEKQEDGTWKVDRAASHSRRQQHRESQLYKEQATASATASKKRPILLKRSSSDSQALLLPIWNGSYQDAVDNLRSLRAPQP
jgi:hypothetical protein